MKKIIFSAALFMITAAGYAQVQIDHKIQFSGSGNAAKVEGVDEVSANHDAANKIYVDTAIANRGSSLSPSTYGFTQSGSLWYKIVWSTGYNTVNGISGQYSSFSVIESSNWRLATQSEINTLRGAGVLPNGFQGWSGDGYPGQESSYQYYYTVNSGSVTWHTSDWGNANYQKAVLIWRP